MEEDMELMAGSDGVSVHQGFPNPAADQAGRRQPLALDFNQLLVRSPSSTYLFRISGHHWSELGIYDGDVAVIDRAISAAASDMVILWQASGFALRRRADLMPDEAPWGVVTATIHQFKRP